MTFVLEDWWCQDMQLEEQAASDVQRCTNRRRV